MLAYRVLRWFLGLVTRVFFRQIAVVGLEHVPAGEPVIFAGNHPNSLIDPILMVTTCGRIVSFAAKDVLFRSRLLRVVLRALGAVPVARREDHAEVSSQNEKAFDAMYEILARRGAIGIFPEGLSHDASQLARLKTGAARLALEAAARHGRTVYLAPCGLTFFHPKRFRSRVLVQYGPTIAVGADELAAWRADGPAAVRALTAALDRALRGLTVNAEDWQTMRVLDGVRRLYQPPRITVEQRIELARRFNDHYPAVRDQADVRAHYDRVAGYLAKLDALGLSDGDLRGMSAGRAFGKLLRYLALVLFWLPLAAPGVALHGPVVLFARHAGRWLAPRKDVVATTKLIVGMLFILLAYAGLIAAAGVARGWPAAAAAAVLLPASGYATLQVLDRATSLKQGLRTLVGMLRLRREVDSLRAERAELEAATVTLVETYRPAELAPLFPRAGG